MNNLIPVNYESENPTVLGRQLHEFLEVETPYDKWFPRMCEYGFTEEIDFTTFLSESTGGRPATNNQLTIEMAKEICMIQRTDKGKQARQYFLDLEKKWNSPEFVMARALKMADKRILAIQGKADLLTTENKLLTGQVLTWANKDILNAIIKAYGSKVGFEDGWRDFNRLNADYRRQIDSNYAKLMATCRSVERRGQYGKGNPV